MFTLGGRTLFKKSMRIPLLVLGWFFFLIGGIGAFLPILPTVPFWLLAGICFSKAEPKLHQWLRGLPKAGQAIRDWEDHSVIKSKTKIIVTIFLLLSLINLWFWVKVKILVKIIASLTIVLVNIFIVTRPSSVNPTQKSLE